MPDGDQIPLHAFMPQAATCRGFIGYFCEYFSEQKNNREVRQKKKLSAEEALGVWHQEKPAETF